MRIAAVGLLLGATVLWSCGGDSGTTQPPVTPVPASVQLSATTVTLRIGETSQLTANVLDQQGRPMAGQAITWRTSDTTKISVDAAGLVRGVRSGTAAVTVSSGALTATASGTVVAPQIQLAAGTVEQTIGPEGGSLTTTDAAGRRYTLTLSPGWKAESTAVAITALAGIDNLPVGSTLLAGAHFAPEGLELDVPGTLTIEGVSAPASGLITGFGYTGTGADLYRASAGVTGGTMTFVVSHFSGTGASNVQDASTYPTAPLTGGSWVYMETIVNLAHEGQQTGTYDVPAIVGLLNDWATGIVERALVAAGSDALLVTALGRLRQWRYIVFCGTASVPCRYGTPLNLWPATVSGSVLLGVSAAHTRLHSEARTSLGAADTRAYEACVVNQDLQAAKNTLYWGKQGDLFLAPGETPTVASVLANFCVKVVIEDASFPQNPAPNVPATLRVGGGLRFGTGPVTHRYPVEIEVNASGVTPGHRIGTIPANDPNPAFPFSFTPDGVDDVFFGIRVKEPWSGWDVHQDTIVHRPLNVGVAVTPPAAILNPGAQATFTATVTGVSNTAVTWTATGGTITAGGVYTAGSGAGTFQVTATSVANPIRSGTAQVTILSTGSIRILGITRIRRQVQVRQPNPGPDCLDDVYFRFDPPVPASQTIPLATCTFNTQPFNTGQASTTASASYSLQTASGQPTTLTVTGTTSANVTADGSGSANAWGFAEFTISFEVVGASVPFDLAGSLSSSLSNPQPTSHAGAYINFDGGGSTGITIDEYVGRLSIPCTDNPLCRPSNPATMPLNRSGTLPPGQYTLSLYARSSAFEWNAGGSLTGSAGFTITLTLRP